MTDWLTVWNTTTHQTISRTLAPGTHRQRVWDTGPSIIDTDNVSVGRMSALWSLVAAEWCRHASKPQTLILAVFCNRFSL